MAMDVTPLSTATQPRTQPAAQPAGPQRPVNRDLMQGEGRPRAREHEGNPFQTDAVGEGFQHRGQLTPDLFGPPGRPLSPPVSPAQHLPPLPNLKPNVHQPPDSQTRIATIQGATSLSAGTAPNLWSGRYQFVLPADRPNAILLRPDNSQQGMGHTSMLAHGQQASYAGVLEYKRGQGVTSWSNESGHFQPPASSAAATGLPMSTFHPWTPPAGGQTQAQANAPAGATTVKERIDAAVKAREGDIAALVGTGGDGRKRLAGIVQEITAQLPGVTKKQVNDAVVETLRRATTFVQ